MTIFAICKLIVMNFKTFCIFVAAMVLLALHSCKKEEETKVYMDGTLKMEHSMPKYVKPGEKYTFTASGITAPDGTPVAYYFYSSASNNRSDTLRTPPYTYTYEIPDTLGAFSMNVVAYPVESYNKYYVSTESVNFITVSDDPFDGSLTNILPREDEMHEELFDRNYALVYSGGKEWIRSNLSRIDRDAQGKEVFGMSYAQSKAMQNIFGSYYTWEEAVNACPPGWHLPSDAEWVDLLKDNGAPDSLQPFETSPSGAGNLMVKGYFNGSEMWYYYRGVKITDVSISAIPVGYATMEKGSWSFLGYQNYAVFWTADEFEGKGVYRYIYKEYDNVFVGSADKTGFAASVRCVR